MLAFLRRFSERRHACALQSSLIKPAQRSMNISKKFLEILQLSFEVRYLGKDVQFSKKKNKIKAIEDRMDVLFNNVQDVSTNPKFDDIVALAAAYYNIALEYSKENCELAIASTHLFKSMELLREKQLDPKAILTSIGALNELDAVFQKSETECKHSLKFLPEAQNLYINYVFTTEDCPDPIHIGSLIGFREEESDPIIILDNFHTRTLHSLGIHYLAKPKDKHEFVMYLDHILHSQLTNMVYEGKCDEQFEEKDIALTLFDLSKYFLANDRFTEAKNYIITADYVIHKFFPNKMQTEEDERNETQLNPSCEKYDYIRAISDSSWGSYGVHLLRFWVDKFLQNKENTSSEIQELISELVIEPKDSKLLILSDFKKELECIIDRITEARILNLADAKSVFVKTLRHLDGAKDYFFAHTDIESYAKVILEISNAYKYFAGFEEQRNKRIKLHKRRVECLENVCEKVGELHTTTVDTKLQICKRNCYEMITSCSTIMDLTLEETYNDKTFKETSAEVHQYVKLIQDYIDIYLNIN